MFFLQKTLALQKILCYYMPVLRDKGEINRGNVDTQSHLA